MFDHKHLCQANHPSLLVNLLFHFKYISQHAWPKNWVRYCMNFSPIFAFPHPASVWWLPWHIFMCSLLLRTIHLANGRRLRASPGLGLPARGRTPPSATVRRSVSVNAGAKKGDLVKVRIDASFGLHARTSSDNLFCPRLTCRCTTQAP